MQSIRSHGWTRGINFDLSNIPFVDTIDPTFLFLNVGYNLRLSDPQAAIGIVQLKKLSGYVESRQRAAERFVTNIQNSSKLSTYLTYPTVHPKQHQLVGFPILIILIVLFR